jgi:AraC-like DNA-binding protein
MQASTEKIEPFRFSTDVIDPKDRVAVWREVLGRVYLRLELNTLDKKQPRAALEAHALGPASLCFSETTAGSAARTRELIQDGNGDFRFLWVLGGHYQCISEMGIEQVACPDAGLICSDMPRTIVYPNTSSVISLTLRRDILTGAVRGLEGVPFRSVRNSQPLRLLAGYIKLLHKEGPPRDPALAHKLGQQLADLAAFALDPTLNRAAQNAGSLKAVRLAAIRADVFANLGQVRLSAKTLAQRHGLSDRYIHRLFEETGQTFGDFVLDERLKRAYQLLTDPAQTGKSVGEIAAEAGFGDLSTFHRTFRRRFGDTPRAARRAGLAQQSGSNR